MTEDDPAAPDFVFAVSDRELAAQAKATRGDVLWCPECNDSHVLEPGQDQNGEDTDLILFYRCGDTAKVGAVDGRWVISLLSERRENKQ